MPAAGSSRPYRWCRSTSDGLGAWLFQPLLGSNFWGIRDFLVLPLWAAETPSGKQMRCLRAPSPIRPGLLLTGNLSRGEVCYWSRDRTRREAEIRPYLRLAVGFMIQFIQDRVAQCTLVVQTDKEAHEAAQEYVTAGRMPRKRAGSRDRRPNCSRVPGSMECQDQRAL